jgi:hypothetical protein
MYPTCSTRARMSGTDTTLLRGVARSDSLPSCEMDQTCQYDQHGLDMSVAMPKILCTCSHKSLPAVNSGCLAPHVRARWAYIKCWAYVGPRCHSRRAHMEMCQFWMHGPACQSLVGPYVRICGARMLEFGGPLRLTWVPCGISVAPTWRCVNYGRASPHVRAWWGPHVRVWWACQAYVSPK